MSEGWIKLHRQLINWGWFASPNILSVFLYLLLDANHKDQEHFGVMVKRGQTKTGRKIIAGHTGLSEMKVRTALKNLEKSGEITISATANYSMITIVKYDEYQGDNQAITKQQPSDNQAITTNKNDNNDKNNIPVRAEPPSLEKLLFDLGREVLGQKSGGVIVKLKNKKGVAEAYSIIELAANKSDPMAYVNGAMKKDEYDPMDGVEWGPVG